MSSSFTALYLAYSIIWLGLFSYLAYLYVKQRSIDRDIKALKEEVHRRDH